ncbi:MAG: uridylate kinase, partial [Pseudomonadota bacterium]
MWVIKLGGSLLGAPELLRWLELLVKFGDGKVVIVPGGGLFANSVREAQQISNASDEVAHQLALLAMDQFGLLLAGMNPGLVTASSELELAERGWQHRGIVWLPSKMALADTSIPQNWQVTSDSL